MFLKQNLINKLACRTGGLAGPKHANRASRSIRFRLCRRGKYAKVTPVLQAINKSEVIDS